MPENNNDVKKMPFERAIEELESIVKRLEEGKVPLEESVAIYERGEALKTRCEELLRQAEARVEKITLNTSGKPTGSRIAPQHRSGVSHSAWVWGFAAFPP
jgi:exodeoxyribonuclease VII small subunit